MMCPSSRGSTKWREDDEEEEDILTVVDKWNEGKSERWVKKDSEVLVSLQDDCYILKKIEDLIHADRTGICVCTDIAISAYYFCILKILCTLY